MGARQFEQTLFPDQSPWGGGGGETDFFLLKIGETRKVRAR